MEESIDAVDQLLEKRWSPSTIKRYNSCIRTILNYDKHKNPLDAKTDIRQLSIDRVKSFVNGYILAQDKDYVTIHKSSRKVNGEVIEVDMNSKTTIDAFFSAIKFCYTKNSEQIPEELMILTKNVSKGYKNEMAQLKSKGLVVYGQGKRPILISDFQKVTF